jgi:hypothetical protein
MSRIRFSISKLIKTKTIIKNYVSQKGLFDGIGKILQLMINHNANCQVSCNSTNYINKKVEFKQILFKLKNNCN